MSEQPEADDLGGARLIGNILGAGQFHNYDIAGNRCGAFAIGSLSSFDDFYLIGSEPGEEAASYPMLTGNVLDSDGHILFRLVRNVLEINPGHCSKIESDRIGYDIVDSAGIRIMSVRTRFDGEPGDPRSAFVTTLSGNFYDKSGRVVARAAELDGEPSFQVATNMVIGDRNFIAINMGMSDESARIALIAWRSGGRIYEVLSGEIADQTVLLDGKYLDGARFVRCQIVLKTGVFGNSDRGVSFGGCQFIFSEGAANVANLIKLIDAQGDQEPPAS